jgi:hypothetical protein
MNAAYGRDIIPSLGLVLPLMPPAVAKEPLVYYDDRNDTVIGAVKFYTVNQGSL